MTCRGCRGTRGLGQINAANGQTFLRCLLSELGLDPTGKWSEAAHVALYDRASAVINLRGDRTAEQVRLERFGSNPQRAAEIAANLPAMVVMADLPFWTCLGLTRDAAVASMTSRSGVYWNATVAAGYVIVRAEGGSVKVRPRGSLAAALLTLAVGAGGLLWLGD